MKAINWLKLNILYSELKKLNMDPQILEKIISNKDFHFQYKKYIKPFLERSKKFAYSEYDYEMIEKEAKEILELSINNNSNKYITFLIENPNYREIITDFHIFNDKNFEKLYSIIGENIFKKNICEVINKGYSEQLIKLININPNFILQIQDKDFSSIFEENVWNIIRENPHVGNKTLFEIFNKNIDIIAKIIAKDLYEGFVYTYENINESHILIEEYSIKTEEEYILQLFSKGFINNMGDEMLKKIYTNKNIILNDTKIKKIIEISQVGNYELIKDVINYDEECLIFNNITTNDMNKSLLEINQDIYNHQAIFMNKYFNIEQKNFRDINLFIKTLKNVKELPIEFKEKYGSILELINKILISNQEQLIEISKNINIENKDEYKELLSSCEKDGNNILKKEFVNEINQKNIEITSKAVHTVITAKDDKNVHIYELSGEPFTMLVHAVTNNKSSEHNSFVNEIISNPENWDKITNGNNYISTSVISDKYMHVYDIPNENNTVMFGFSNIPHSSLQITAPEDLGTNRTASNNIDFNKVNKTRDHETNTIITLEELINKTIEKNINVPPQVRMWNEIILSRKDDNTGANIKPDYIVCMDTISETSINAAQKLNIPIYKINRKYYKELPYINQKTESLSKTNTLTH